MSTAPSPTRHHRGRNGGTWAIWTLLVIAALITAFPLYWMVATSLTGGTLTQSQDFRLWPADIGLDNYTAVFRELPVGHWIVNSLLIATVGTVLTVVVSLLAGFAFAKYRFRGRTAIFFAYLLTIMVPIQVTLVPSFLVIVKLGLVDTVWGVILPGAAEATAVFIARQFMLNIPTELLEAARIDGAGELRIFLRVVLPLSGPLIGVLTVLAFMARWNEFLWPLIVLQGEDNLTLPVGLAGLQGSESFAAPWGPIMAMATLTTLPVLVIFLLCQRQFVQGIANTGLK
ncbi:carbohydrate ABC transporter permease [Streptomyces millisiae]|uniref:Carbohydrate ABC transporter permease n=1 Tax=Streptomyces millisiae TaxID=3075542 RepID=A0ABU2LHC5_9ACTN|nr:carbohydrate ABC transporter permease [Streptomyces sp. DSM 44918]MDT0316967.1 carbohydrate ABC transporter permease [Streptomyces sp. DSM 44918]